MKYSDILVTAVEYQVNVSANKKIKNQLSYCIERARELLKQIIICLVMLSNN